MDPAPSMAHGPAPAMVLIKHGPAPAMVLIKHGPAPSMELIKHGPALSVLIKQGLATKKKPFIIIICYYHPLLAVPYPCLSVCPTLSAQT